MGKKQDPRTVQTKVLIRADCNRIGQLECTAVKGTVRKWFPGLQREQDLFIEPFIVHIAANLSKTLHSALFRTEEEIIHMEDITVIICSQLICQSGLASGAVAVDCHNYLGFQCQQPINLQLYE